MNYSRHISNWLEFLKMKLDTAKRLSSNSGPENYVNRKKKIKVREDLLELENSKLAELKPLLEDLREFYAGLRTDNMNPNSSDDDLKKREIEKIESLGSAKASLAEYLRELENNLATQEELSGRPSTKKDILPTILEAEPEQANTQASTATN